VTSLEIALGVVSIEDRWFYRAVDEEPSHDPVRLLVPYDWVARSALFRRLPPTLDPRHLAELDALRRDYPRYPSLEKCVGEAIYERVRRRVAPSAPSRLRCTFAALDAVSAMKFAVEWYEEVLFDEHGLSDFHAIRVRTAGSPWIAVDMNLFSIPVRIGQSQQRNAHALAAAAKRARRYWAGEHSRAPVVEILAESLAY
jgi:hypothetical protein